VYHPLSRGLINKEVHLFSVLCPTSLIVLAVQMGRWWNPAISCDRAYLQESKCFQNWYNASITFQDKPTSDQTMSNAPNYTVMELS